MTLPPNTLRQAMRRWTTGVAVATAAQDHVRHGMTVNSFTSLSLDPPYVMVSLENHTRTYEIVLVSQAFGVTILSADQQDISDRFANPNMELGYRFEGLETFSLTTGSPFIKGGLAFFDCRVVTTLVAGTQTVFVGEVVSAKEGDDRPPLVYYDQGYRRMRE
ncbi:MAG TPA: flavin reductase family protein [Anaerolineales bacterium]|nr:flavin reductase family protein [Anaerolineales bacterium]